MRTNLVRLLSGAILVGGLSVSSIAQGADLTECMALLRYGIYDQVSVVKKDSGQKVDRSSACQANSGESSSGFGVMYAGFGVEGRSADAFRNFLCHSDMTESEFQSDFSYVRASINTELLRTVDDCIHVATNGLQVRSDLLQQDTALVISVYYAPHPGLEDSKIKITGFQTIGNIQCEGNLKDSFSGKNPSDAIIGNSVKELTCEISEGKDEIKLSDDKIEVPGGAVIVSTSAGTIMREIPPHFPHSRNVEKEIDDLKKALGTQYVVVREGQAKIAGRDSGWVGDQTVTFDNPFPSDYKIQTIVLTIDGPEFFQPGGYPRWTVVSSNNNGFVWNLISGMHGDWTPLSVHYVALATESKL